MNKNRLIYWISTGLFSLAMLLSAINYLSNEEMFQAFEHLGFPGYFRVELAIAKFLGALVLLIPTTKFNIKEWAYAGFGITLLSAAIAHASVGDEAGQTIAPFVVFLILAVSYIFKSKVQSKA